RENETGYNNNNDGGKKVEEGRQRGGGPKINTKKRKGNANGEKIEREWEARQVAAAIDAKQKVTDLAADVKNKTGSYRFR
ncbi:hypothetical protein PIB30_011776, partial [Stylosanthes scabra]|nr:hypothetical protein [Stylosanthes scabra]